MLKQPGVVLLLCLTHFFVNAQECNHCKEMPKLTQFDFDIKVPQPNAADGTNELWPEWKNLFILASSVGTEIKKADGACIQITKPPSLDTGDVEELSTGGETFTNLPSNPLISSNLSRYGDYLLTGVITSEGAVCKLHAEIQTSCGRKVVAKADITFPLSSVVTSVSSLAQQIAQQLSPAEKIKQFEEEERIRDGSLSLFQMSPGEPMTIKTAKKTLKAGESTSFTIELKDCDGKPVAGREILFNGSEFKGFNVQGTLGGAVQPQKVITDANGTAKATFTLKSGASEALIAAYSPGKNVKGCESMFYGDAPINIRYTYSGYVKYSSNNMTNCSEEATSGCLKAIYKGNETSNVTYTASFYSKEEKGASFDIFLGDESGGLVPDKMDGGSYTYDANETRKHVIVCESVSKGQTTLQWIDQKRNGDLKKGNVRFSFYGDGGHVALDLVFNTQTLSRGSQTYLGSHQSTSTEETSWNVAFDSMLDKDLNIKKEKTSKGIKYTIQAKRQRSFTCSTLNETLNMVIYEE